MRKPKTHFEQVPLKDVRKLVTKSAARKTPAASDLAIEPPTAKAEPFDARGTAASRNRR